MRACGQLHRSDLWRVLGVAPVLLLACPPPVTIPLTPNVSAPPTISITGAQQECPGPSAPPGESWVTTESQGPKTIPLPRQGALPELNATHTGTGSLWLTASAADPKAGISTISLQMNAVGCSLVNGSWSSSGDQVQNGGIVVSTFSGTETGSFPNQRVTGTGTTGMVFDVSNYLNGACSGTCTAGSGNNTRSTVNAAGTPCCAEFTADQVDFEFYIYACNYSGGCGYSNVIQYVGFSASGLQAAVNHPGTCLEAWPAHNPPVGPVTTVPACTGR
jgi:hypothetical protein